eukprot:CAMPEP_0118635890 /NCGR_PEP_ID=MMETSP0785-20121206/2318_1 /TAXON_ID=91992 /ORGANISM="Bolidomonas pacifica, Strain CCMP 1866" /LENGTH=1136 /DNA_ID=CAMNT_0006526955 /DNA_START=277 /DNA_END=3683 /DNA_ORIENTATION=+
MVGYAQSLQNARRPGWEEAYIDYESLKQVLSMIEEIWSHIPASEVSEMDHRGSWDEGGEEEPDEDDVVGMGSDWIQSFSNSPSKSKRALQALLSGGRRSPSPTNFVGRSNVTEGTTFDDTGTDFTTYSTIGKTYERLSKVFHLNANNHHKTNSQILFPPIRRVADAKVLALAERFLGLLQSEIEKVSLFALSRIGELSDTVGSLRFGDTKVLSGEVQQFRNSTNDIMGSGSQMRMRNRSYSQSSNSSSSSIESDNNYEASTPSDITNAFPQARQKSASLPATSSSNHSSYYHHHLQNNPPSSFYSNDDLNNTNQRPMFTDHFLGEESILVSAVDEVDAYVQVGIEVLHLLRYICVNAMAARKILKKHDKLLANRMMGSHYHQLRSISGSSMNVDKASNDSKSNAGNQDRSMSVNNPPRANASYKLAGGADAHLRALCNGAGIAAISASLIAALSEYETAHNRAEEFNRAADSTGNSMYHSLGQAVKLDKISTPVGKMNSGGALNSQSDTPNFPVQRLKNCVSSIQTVRLAADIAYNPFELFLSRRALTVTGSRLGDLGGSSLEALTFLLKYDPSTAPMEKASKFWSSVEDAEDPNELAIMKQSAINEYVNLLSIFLYTTNYYIISPTSSSYAELLRAGDSAFGSALVGATSSSAFFAAFLYSFWLRQKLSFKAALLLSALAPILGNVLYAYALTLDSLNVAYVGRLFVGLGSAEVCNRQFIALSIDKTRITSACARFVAASAIGMSAGPFMAAIIDQYSDHTLTVDVPILGGLIFNHTTGPGWIMAILYLIHLSLIVFAFNEPGNIYSIQTPKLERDSTGGSPVTKQHKVNVSNCDSVDTPVPKITIDVHDENFALLDGAEGGYGATNSAPPSPASSTSSTSSLNPWFERLYSLLSMPYRAAESYRFYISTITANKTFCVTLLLFALIEMTDEILINSVSVITRRYFRWHGASAGTFAAALGIFVLPANYIIEKLCSTKYDERAVMRFMLYLCIVGIIFTMNYQVLLGFSTSYDTAKVYPGDLDNSAVNEKFPLTQHVVHAYDGDFGVYQYVIGVSWIFFGTIMLEGVVTSLMAKSAPSRLEMSFVNAGLLATLIGTLGRVCGDAFIVGAGYLHSFEGLDFVNGLLVLTLMALALG